MELTLDSQMFNKTLLFYVTELEVKCSSYLRTLLKKRSSHNVVQMVLSLYFFIYFFFWVPYAVYALTG